MADLHPTQTESAAPQEAGAESLAAPPVDAADDSADPARRGLLPNFRHNEIWTYFGPAFVASVAYIDPGNFATNILGGTQFGYRLLWVLLWANAMGGSLLYTEG